MDPTSQCFQGKRSNLCSTKITDLYSYSVVQVVRTKDIGGKRMRPALLEILACPICKNSLRLEIAIQNEAEILTGSLFCDICAEIYLIEDGIPNLLPPELRSV